MIENDKKYHMIDKEDWIEFSAHDYSIGYLQASEELIEDLTKISHSKTLEEFKESFDAFFINRKEFLKFAEDNPTL